MRRYKKIKLKDGTTKDEHRLIKKVTGCNNCVHHIDGNGMNNDPANLLLMSRSAHAKHHGLGTKIRPLHQEFFPDEDGMAICRKCGDRFPWEQFPKNVRYKHGRKTSCIQCSKKQKRKEYLKRNQQ